MGLFDEKVKRCNDCKTNLPIDSFTKDARRPDGISSICRGCNSVRRKRYYLKNRDRELANAKEYYNNNREKFRERESKRWKNRKEYMSNYVKQRRANDPLFRIAANMRISTRKYCIAIKQNKNFSLSKAIGCSRDYFKKYIEDKFTEGMSWDNYGMWEIDHIKPLSLALSVDDINELSHYTNLQPLWERDNQLKSNNYGTI